jgi:hypothetical protein
MGSGASLPGAGNGKVQVGHPITGSTVEDETTTQKNCEKLHSTPQCGHGEKKIKQTTGRCNSRYYSRDNHHPGVAPAAATNFRADDLTSVFEEAPRVSVREDSLLAALSQVKEIVGHIKDSLKSTKLSLDAITIELGVSASGHVGFLGTGVEAEASAKFSLEIKVERET